jgi:hypothetical protein
VRRFRSGFCVAVCCALPVVEEDVLFKVIIFSVSLALPLNTFLKLLANVVDLVLFSSAICLFL